MAKQDPEKDPLPWHGPEKLEMEGTHVRSEHIYCVLRDVCDSKPSSGLCAPCLFGFDGRITGCYYVQPTDFCWGDED